MKPFDQPYNETPGMPPETGRGPVITARHGAMVVDCANYYRDLHESLSKAEHSIFILGWDIDSRIELIRRDEDRVHQTPVTLLELLTLKARENPDLQIYLNKWNYVFFMAATREPLSLWKWRKAALNNIHYCHDAIVPVGACHHQKIVVVDDETAYIGGMDVAIARWDTREHDPSDPNRKDPGGVYNASAHKDFPPYHDIQTVVSGEAAFALAKIVRERWLAAAGYDAIPPRENRPEKDICPSWPDTDPPDFYDIDTSLYRTLPEYGGFDGLFEIEQSYLDQIKTANHFIYIENQYFTVKKIAAALNRRMKENPDLRILLVSSYNPQGFIEKISMWAGRIRFKKILEDGIQGQACMAYPAVRKEDGTIQSVRIHSKVMIVDDKILRVGSANLNNRSMRLDTECDLVYYASTGDHRNKFADIRNDLIHEHSGIAREEVAAIAERRADPHDYLYPPAGSDKRLVEIDDSEFFVRFPNFIAGRLGDPRRCIIPEILPMPYAKNFYLQYFTKRQIAKVLLFFLLLIAGAVAWKNGLFHEYASREKLIELFDDIRSGPWAVPKAIGLYTLASIAFVPVTLLTGITALIFGYWYGLLVSLSGALLAAAFGFWAGRLLGGVKIGLLETSPFKRVQKFASTKSNVIGLTFLRMLPVAPYGIVNMALGILHVPFLVFISGTLFGLLPGKLVAMFLADSVAELWKNPDWKNIGLIAAGLAAWIGVVWLTHYLYKIWQGRAKPVEA